MSDSVIIPIPDDYKRVEPGDGVCLEPDNARTAREIVPAPDPGKRIIVDSCVPLTYHVE